MIEKIKTKILKEIAKGKSFWEILRDSDFLLKDFIQAMNEIYEKGLIKTENNRLVLTKKGRKKINESSLMFEPKICNKCGGKRILLNDSFKKIFLEYKKIVKERPFPELKYFQGYMNEYDVIARIAFIHLCDGLENKKIVLVGDDDLVSIALALTNLAKRICVLDIDEKLGEYINEICKKHKLDIEFYHYDVSDPLPKTFVGKFDIFSSEPLETLSGLKAFLARGVSCLKDNGSGYFGLTRAEASYKKWLEIEKFLNRMNCVITDLISGFSVYPTLYGNISFENFVKMLNFPVERNEGIDWYKSSLFRIEVLGKPKLIIPPEKKIKIKFVDAKEDLTMDVKRM